jgi:mannose-6-phosphate isomerase-like protein (cupin superfamily)
MLQTVETHLGVPWDARTPFERWIEDDLRLELRRGYVADRLATCELQPWPEHGLSVAFYDIVGAESLAGMYVGEIPPARSRERVRQLYDEVIYVVSGHGSTTVTTPTGTLSFEWGPGSLFAVPLNYPHQLHNGTAREPVRFISVNTLPITFNLLRDPDFIFGTDHDFRRINPERSPAEAVLYQPDPTHNRTAVDLYETMFVPDIQAVPLSQFAERGEGARTVYFELANSPISAHVAEFQGGQFVNPHRHGPSAYVFTLEGSGYSLMWSEGGSAVRYDWPEGDVGLVVPPNWWWHGHFITSPRALQLAIKLRSRKVPINHLFDKTHKLISEGGTVLRYADLAPALRNEVWSTYVRECARHGLAAQPPGQ